MEGSPPTGAAPDPSVSEIWLPRVLGALASVPVVLGVLKTIAEAGTGESVAVADIVYYVGWAALGAYGGFFIGGFATGATAWLMENVPGIEQNDDILVGIFGIFVVLFMIGAVVSAGPPAASESPGFFRVLGLLTVVGAGVAYAVIKSPRQ